MKKENEAQGLSEEKEGTKDLQDRTDKTLVWYYYLVIPTVGTRYVVILI